MYTLHIANKNYSSWSLRPWILMTELGIAFEEVLTPFKAVSNWEVFRSFSPTGLVPCLVDGDVTVWDSMAITEYLAESHTEVWPEDRVMRAWARCAAAEMHAGFSALRNECPMNCGVKVKLNEITPALQREITRLDELWCYGLENFGGPFLAGNTFSAVDAFFAPVVFRLKTYGLDVSPTASAYIEQMLSLTSMQDWDHAALNETWRDTPHEDDIGTLGVIVEDLRKT